MKMQKKTKQNNRRSDSQQQHYIIHWKQHYSLVVNHTHLKSPKTTHESKQSKAHQVVQSHSLTENLFLRHTFQILLLFLQEFPAVSTWHSHTVAACLSSTSMWHPAWFQLFCTEFRSGGFLSWCKPTKIMCSCKTLFNSTNLSDNTAQ